MGIVRHSLLGGADLSFDFSPCRRARRKPLLVDAVIGEGRNKDPPVIEGGNDEKLIEAAPNKVPVKVSVLIAWPIGKTAAS